MALTDEQTAEVDQKRLGTDRPEYYSADSRSNTAINEDLEAFIILAEPDLLAEIEGRIEETAEVKKDRDKLYQECIDAEGADAVEVIEHYQEKIEDLSSFKIRMGDSPLGSSVGVADLMADAQSSQAEALEQFEYYFNRISMIRMLNNARIVGGSNEHATRQQSSWSFVFGSY